MMSTIKRMVFNASVVIALSLLFTFSFDCDSGRFGVEELASDDGRKTAR